MLNSLGHITSAAPTSSAPSEYHPDVSEERDAEARFKEVTEAHEALIDPERRAACDSIDQRHASGQSRRADDRPAPWPVGA